VSRDFLGDDRFVMFLGDNVIQGGISELIEQFGVSKWNSQIVLTRVAQPEQYGVAELNGDGQIVRLVEKPKQPPSDLALVGIYMFDRHIHEATENITPSWRGELEITDAIQWLVEQNYQVYPYIHRGWWIDTGAPSAMLDAIINSVVRGPTIIGERTRVVNSYVGPFTSIYHDVVIEDSEIERAIVLENSYISDIPARIQDSIIGRNVTLARSAIKPKAYKFTLGDHSQVGIL
jgi:glucose-1-phosphate thymidylyltransferase